MTWTHETTGSTAAQTLAGRSSPNFWDAIPELGFRNYWYPASRSQKVRSKKPTHIQRLGEHIVLFRDARTGTVHALEDRCAHRGFALSKSRIYYPGLISCAYHGWTYDGSGNCVAFLSEGPDCPLLGKVRIRSYPVEELRGIVWIWMGDLEPVPLREDIPEEFYTADLVFTSPQWTKCNWRYWAENSDGHHAQVLHRRSVPATVFSPETPAWIKPNVLELADGKGVGHYDQQRGPLHDFYPGVGLWPPRLPWWERGLKKLLGHGPKTVAVRRGPGDGHSPPIVREVHLPGWRRIRTRSQGAIIEWPVPIDAERTLNFRAYCFYPASLWTRADNWVRYHLWWTWARNGRFNGQDKFAVENLRPGPERLQANDRTVTAWRKIAATRARGHCGPES